MRTITAPEDIILDDVSVFLAGGITDCPWWQKNIISRLQNENGILLNPRRVNFDVNNGDSAEQQIAWEFEALEKADIFSIWFSSGMPSKNPIQPIALYELGRHLAKREHKLHTVVIGVSPAYIRERDVFEQIKNIDLPLWADISDSLDEHAEKIITAINKIRSVV